MRKLPLIFSTSQNALNLDPYLDPYKNKALIVDEIGPYLLSDYYILGGRWTKNKDLCNGSHTKLLPESFRARKEDLSTIFVPRLSPLTKKPRYSGLIALFRGLERTSFLPSNRYSLTIRPFMTHVSTY